MDGSARPAPGGGLVVTDRGVSTVLDVSVCLLLVGAAVLTLLGAPRGGPDPSADRADEIASTLAGSTATVSYGHAGENRTAHGTLAGLLADAAVSNATPATGQGFRSAVANVTRPALGAPDWRGQVLVTWRPYEGADGRAGVRVGWPPPSDADVHTATTHVPSGLSPVRQEAKTAAERDGYRGVAAVLARSLPEATDGEEPSEAERRFAADLEATYDSPDAAAREVSVGRVTITVRTWSP